MAIINKRRIVPREYGRNSRIISGGVSYSSGSSSGSSSGGGGDLSGYPQKAVNETITGVWNFSNGFITSSLNLSSIIALSGEITTFNSFTINASNIFANGNPVWHSGNDGIGSGLFADLVTVSEDIVSGGDFSVVWSDGSNNLYDSGSDFKYSPLSGGLTVKSSVSSPQILSNDSDGGVLLFPPIDGNGRYGLKYGSATNVGDIDLMMLCNRAASGEVAIAANTSSGGSSGEVEVARFKVDNSDNKFVGFGITNPIEAFDLYGNQQLTGYLKGSGSFVSGFTGSNWQINPNDNTQSHLTIDRLTVRDRMDVYELVINQIRATNGSLWVSDAVKCESISGTTISVNGDTQITFQADDIIKAQRFDGRDGLVSYTATVSTIGTTSFTVSNVTGTGWDGMELVRVGNTSDTDRQGALYLTSSDNGSPYMDIVDGVNSTSISGRTRVRIGRLDGITNNYGYGIWGSYDGINEAFAIGSGDSTHSAYARLAGWNFDNEALWTGNKGGVSNGDLTLSNTGTHVIRSKNFNVLRDGSVNINGTVTIANPENINASDINNNEGWTDDTLAGTANTTANTALGYANTAQTTADGAQVSANNAQTTANTAKSTTDKLETLATITNNEFKVSSDANNYVRMYLNSSSDWGIEGVIGSNNVFKLGDENRIAGFTFDEETILGGEEFSLTEAKTGMTIRSNSSINSISLYNNSGSVIDMWSSDGS